MAKEKDALAKSVVAVDLGGTKVLAGVVNPKGEILGMAKRPTKADAGPDAVVERIVKTVREAIADAGCQMSDIIGIASGAPGPLDPDTGVVRYPPNLPGWVNIPFAKMLSEGLDNRPVFIENDANLGILGEYILGAGQGYSNLAGIFVGTGIGGGLILDGKLWQGSHKTAAEIGHMVVLAEGPVCGCGRRGCLEALASRTAIERDVWAGIKAGRESIVPQIMERDHRERLTSGALAEAYAQDDSLVSDVFSRAQFFLGLAVSSIINLIDPEIVIMGGGVIEAMEDAFLEPIRRVAYQYTVNKLDARDVKIVRAKLGDNSALLGAAVYARQRLGEL